MGLEKLLMFCRQIEGYLMSHTGTCACSAVARRWHLVWKVTAGKAMSAAHKQHSGLAWNRLCPSCGFAKCQCLLFCGFALFPNLLLTWKEPFGINLGTPLLGPRVWFESMSRRLSVSLVPSLRSNYADCHSTMVDARTHKGLTMEKTNRDAHLCPTMDSKPWSHILFVMISHTREMSQTGPKKLLHHPHWHFCWFFFFVVRV